MRRDLARLAAERFDLLVIGGGIFGAGVARDAALRGLNIALVEQNDFASGVSSQSSKLIHGGFRYLEQWDFSLVAESCRERRILRDIAPHRVFPLPLLLPVYRNDRRPLWLLRMGMTLYDLLALYRNVEPHRTLTAAGARALEPSLRGENLVGAIRYFDCQEDDARFCIDNLLHAADLGAACANYCRVIGFHMSGNSIEAATVRDSLTGDTFAMRARVVINAAGPWVEQVARLAPAPQPPPSLSPTKGVHLLLPALTQSHGVFFQGKADGRMMFVLPWNGCTLVGTTDTDFTGDPSRVEADEADIAYLLSEAIGLFPDAGLRRGDVITTTAGIRPLLKSSTANPSDRTREHQILQRGDNLLTLAGGKYTTYRLIAQQAVDRAYGLLGQSPARCTTATTPLPNPRPPVAGERLADRPDVYASDVVHAVQEEMAQSVADVARRRAGLALSRHGGPDVLAKVAALMKQASSVAAREVNAAQGT